MPRQIAIHVSDEAVLDRIDAAAEAAGESRSTFILKAALQRVNSAAMSAKERKALALEIGEAAVKAMGF